ncbi:transglycosylase SLT domain-containing protein [Frankia sp. AgW1.1]|uniref:transglycosylase SLT domain-containing protein n=1 Tax=Frankia sp. AgW1.1 TaxID=1836971 RepID=UPI0019332C2A|nr:transglycosylase SLT domain-containing protein [Frankia sp. AgW1.1]MBL7487060.1 transglycosylase SLT domain-containing protein [Frankia sp. AgW1.1]
MKCALARMLAVVAVASASIGIPALPARAEPAPNVAPVIAFARAQVGKPYTLGATGPQSWDCSALVQAAWRTAGVELPRVTTDQIGAAGWVSLTSIQPGDLVFRSGSEAKKPGHVGLYVGDGQVVEAKGSAWGTIVTPLAQWHAQSANRPGTPGVNGYIDAAAARTGVPRDLLRALLWQESGFNPHAGSGVGAQGIAQFMPTTWSTRGHGGDVLNPADAIPAMADMLADLIRHNNGSIPFALAAYNAGQGRVDQFGGVPPVTFAQGQTFNYVKNIMASAGLDGDHLDLHPVPTPAPPMASQIRTAAIAAIALPALPRTPTDWVGDLAVGGATIGLALWLLHLFAPAVYTAWKARVRSEGRRAASAVRTKAQGSARLRPVVEAVDRRAATTRPRMRRAGGTVRIVRAGTGFVRTTATVSARGRRRSATGSATWPTRSGNSATAVRGYIPTRPSGSAVAAPLTVQLLATAVDLVRLFRIRVFGFAAPRIVANWGADESIPDPATGYETSGRPHAQAPRPQAAPHAEPATSAPDPATAPTSATNPARSPAMASAYETDLDEHLPPVFAHLLRAATALDELDLSSGPVDAALLVFLDRFATAWSEKTGHIADQFARRNFARSVVAAVRDGSERFGDSADEFRKGQRAMRDSHPDLFEVRVSKTAESIAG